MIFDLKSWLDVGAAVLTSLGIASLKMLVVATVILLFLKLLRVKNPRIQSMAWIVVLAGMLLLPFAPYLITPSVSVSILTEKPAPAAAIEPQDIERQPDLAGKSSITNRSLSTDGVDTPANPLIARVMQNWPEIAEAALLTTYLLGLLVMLFRFTKGLMRNRRLLRRCKRIDSQRALEICEEVRYIMGTTPHLTLLSNPAGGSPVTAGFLKPKVVLPDDWADWEEGKLESALAHEMAHVARHDYLVLLLATVNKCVNWFNPLSWLVARRLSDLAEIASDNSAVGYVKDNHKYAEFLLELAAHSRTPALEGVPMVRNAQLLTRIDLILQSGNGHEQGNGYLTALVGICSICLLATTALFGVSLWSTTSAETLATPDSVMPTDASRTEVSDEKLLDSQSSELDPVSAKRNGAVTSGVPKSEPAIQGSKDGGGPDQKSPAISAPGLDQIAPTSPDRVVANAGEPDKNRLEHLGTDSVDLLISTLNDGNPILRQQAAAELRQRGGSRAVEPLIRALTDSNANVRQQAAETLGAIGDRRAVRPLISSLKDGNSHVRQMSSQALGNLGADEAVPPLQELSGDNNQFVRQAVENSLKRLGNKRY